MFFEICRENSNMTLYKVWPRYKVYAFQIETNLANENPNLWSKGWNQCLKNQIGRDKKCGIYE